MEQKKQIGRGSYGEIVATSQGAPAPRSFSAAHDILKQAIQKQLIDAPYVDVDRKHRGEALNYDLYDFAPGTALVQRRHTVCTKYGNSPTKNYLMIRRSNGKITVEPVDQHKGRIAKLAKSGLPWGGVIAAITGKRPAKIRVATQEKRNGYKLLALSDEGLKSVWDGSPWRIGKTRIERSTEDHNGGLYYYATLEECMAAAYHNDVFGNARDHRQLMVVEVEASGRHYEHHAEHGTKLCATRIRPVREIAMTLPAYEVAEAQVA